MIAFGIDPGTSRIGYGIIENKGGKLSCLDYGCLKIEKEAQGERLLAIKKSIDFLLKKFKPDLVVLEKLFFYKNIKTAISVAEARGVILLAISEKKIPFLEITPLELKKGITNYGGARKVNIKKILKLFLNLKKEPNPDDAADALALAIIGSR